MAAVQSSKWTLTGPTSLGWVAKSEPSLKVAQALKTSASAAAARPRRTGLGNRRLTDKASPGVRSKGTGSLEGGFSSDQKSGAAMRAEGLEPPRSFDHQDLNLARLPNSATPAWLGRSTLNARPTAPRRFWIL